MADRPYEVLGARTAPMLGRRKQIERLLRHLTKQTPDHVSVIGPKYIGKTMLLKCKCSRKMQRIGIVRIRFENLSVDYPSLFQPARLMMGESLFEQ